MSPRHVYNPQSVVITIDGEVLKHGFCEKLPCLPSRPLKDERTCVELTFPSQQQAHDFVRQLIKSARNSNATDHTPTHTHKPD